MAKRTNCMINGKEYYRLRCKVGERADGKPIMKSFYGSGKKEAEEKYREYMEKLRSSPNKHAGDSLAKLADFYTYQVFIHEDLAAGTIEMYERQYAKFLAPSRLATRPVKDISSADIQLFFNMLAGGELDGKKIEVSQSTISALKKYMVHLFDYLNLNGYCDNLMIKITLPKIGRKRPVDTSDDDDLNDIQVFSEDEVRAIISTPGRNLFLYQLALATGLREGELLGLRYSDFVDGTVRVKRQLHYHYKIMPDKTRMYVGEIQQPKSPSSVRSVPLPDNILQALKKHSATHKAEMMANGYRTDYVFTSDSGNFLERGNFSTAWRRHLKRAGVEHKKFHACRATYCTVLCRRGVPLETASKLMGHSDINVTARFYRMVSDVEMSLAAEKINDLFTLQG